MAAKLYPPRINGTLPAFWLTYDNANLVLRGAEITIPFAMNQTVSAEQVKGFMLRLRTASSGSYIFSPIFSNDYNLSENTVTFHLSSIEASKLNEGQFYKIQIAYCQSTDVNALNIEDNEMVGYFSTVGIIKCTSKPMVYINNLDQENINLFSNQFIGIYDQSDCKDQTEKVYSYEFNVYDKDGNIYYTTGEQLHKSYYDTNNDISLDTVLLNDFMTEDSSYSIQYKVTTINELKLSTPKYALTADGLVSPNKYIKIKPEFDEDTGYTTVRFEGEINEDKSYYYLLDEMAFKNVEMDEIPIFSNPPQEISKLDHYYLYSYNKDNANKTPVDRLKNAVSTLTNKVEFLESHTIFRQWYKDYHGNGYFYYTINNNVPEGTTLVAKKYYFRTKDLLQILQKESLSKEYKKLLAEADEWPIEVSNAWNFSLIDRLSYFEVILPCLDVVEKISYTDVKDISNHINIDSSYITKIAQTEYESLYYGSYILSRASSDDNYSTWYIINRFRLDDQRPSSYSVKDVTIEHGKKYKYALTQYNLWGLQASKMISEVCSAGFEDAYLYDGEKTLRIRYNPEVSSFKITVLEQKSDTLGGRFPFITRNGDTYYREFPIAGLLAQELDVDNSFCNKTVPIGHRHATPSEIPVAENTLRDWHMFSDENIALEREFKMNVLEWLNNGKPKLFKSPYEGNYIVRLMNNSLTPIKELGRMLHNFQSQAYEIAECTYENLVKYGFIKVGFPSDYVGLFRTFNFNDSANFNANGDVDISFDGSLVSFTIQDMWPGDIVYLTFFDNTTEEIMIGITGSYTYIGEKNVKRIVIPQYQYEKIHRNVIGTINCYYYGARITAFDAIMNMTLKTIPSQQYIGIDPAFYRFRSNKLSADGDKEIDADLFNTLSDYDLRDYILHLGTLKTSGTNQSNFKVIIDQENVDIYNTLLNSYDPGDLLGRINATLNNGQVNKLELIKLEYGKFRLRELIPVYEVNADYNTDGSRSFIQGSGSNNPQRWPDGSFIQGQLNGNYLIKENQFNEKKFNTIYVSVSPFGYPYPIEELAETVLLDPFCVFEVFRRVNGEWVPATKVIETRTRENTYTNYYDPYYKTWIPYYDPIVKINYKWKKISYAPYGFNIDKIDTGNKDLDNLYIMQQYNQQLLEEENQKENPSQEKITQLQNTIENIETYIRKISSCIPNNIDDDKKEDFDTLDELLTFYHNQLEEEITKDGEYQDNITRLSENISAAEDDIQRISQYISEENDQQEELDRVQNLLDFYANSLNQEIQKHNLSQARIIELQDIIDVLTECVQNISQYISKDIERYKAFCIARQFEMDKVNNGSDISKTTNIEDYQIIKGENGLYYFAQDTWNGIIEDGKVQYIPVDFEDGELEYSPLTYYFQLDNGEYIKDKSLEPVEDRQYYIQDYLDVNYKYNNRISLTLYDCYEPAGNTYLITQDTEIQPYKIYYYKEYDNQIDMAAVREKDYTALDEVNSISIGSGVMAELTFQLKVFDFYTEYSKANVAAAKQEYLDAKAFFANLLRSYSILEEADSLRKKNQALKELYYRLLYGTSLNGQLSALDQRELQNLLQTAKDIENLHLLQLYEVIEIDERNGDTIVNKIIETAEDSKANNKNFKYEDLQLFAFTDDINTIFHVIDTGYSKWYQEDSNNLTWYYQIQNTEDQGIYFAIDKEVHDFTEDMEITHSPFITLKIVDGEISFNVDIKTKTSITNEGYTVYPLESVKDTLLILSSLQLLNDDEYRELLAKKNVLEVRKIIYQKYAKITDEFDYEPNKYYYFDAGTGKYVLDTNETKTEGREYYTKNEVGKVIYVDNNEQVEEEITKTFFEEEEINTLITSGNEEEVKGTEYKQDIVNNTLDVFKQELADSVAELDEIKEKYKEYYNLVQENIKTYNENVYYRWALDEAIRLIKEKNNENSIEDLRTYYEDSLFNIISQNEQIKTPYDYIFEYYSAIRLNSINLRIMLSKYLDDIVYRREMIKDNFNDKEFDRQLLNQIRLDSGKAVFCLYLFYYLINKIDEKYTEMKNLPEDLKVEAQFKNVETYIINIYSLYNQYYDIIANNVDNFNSAKEGIQLYLNQLYDEFLLSDELLAQMIKDITIETPTEDLDAIVPQFTQTSIKYDDINFIYSDEYKQQQSITISIYNKENKEYQFNNFRKVIAPVGHFDISSYDVVFNNSINNNSSYSMQLNQVRNYIMNNGALNTKFKEDVVNNLYFYRHYFPSVAFDMSYLISRLTLIPPIASTFIFNPLNSKALDPIINKAKSIGNINDKLAWWQDYGITRNTLNIIDTIKSNKDFYETCIQDDFQKKEILDTSSALIETLIDIFTEAIDQSFVSWDQLVKNYIQNGSTYGTYHYYNIMSLDNENSLLRQVLQSINNFNNYIRDLLNEYGTSLSLTDNTNSIGQMLLPTITNQLFKSRKYFMIPDYLYSGEDLAVGDIQQDIFNNNNVIAVKGLNNEIAQLRSYYESFSREGLQYGTFVYTEDFPYKDSENKVLETTKELMYNRFKATTTYETNKDKLTSIVYFFEIDPEETQNRKARIKIITKTGEKDYNLFIELWEQINNRRLVSNALNDWNHQNGRVLGLLTREQFNEPWNQMQEIIPYDPLQTNALFEWAIQNEDYTTQLNNRFMNFIPVVENVVNNNLNKNRYEYFIDNAHKFIISEDNKFNNQIQTAESIEDYKKAYKEIRFLLKDTTVYSDEEIDEEISLLLNTYQAIYEANRQAQEQIDLLNQIQDRPETLIEAEITRVKEELKTTLNGLFANISNIHIFDNDPIGVSQLYDLTWSYIVGKDYKDQVIQLQQETQEAISTLQPEDFSTYDNYLTTVQSIQNSMYDALNTLRSESRLALLFLVPKVQEYIQDLSEKSITKIVDDELEEDGAFYNIFIEKFIKHFIDSKKQLIEQAEQLLLLYQKQAQNYLEKYNTYNQIYQENQTLFNNFKNKYPEVWEYYEQASQNTGSTEPIALLDDVISEQRKKVSDAWKKFLNLLDVEYTKEKKSGLYV